MGFAVIVTSGHEFKLQSHESSRTGQTVNICREKWKTFLSQQSGLVDRSPDAAESHVTQSETKMV